MSESVGTKLKVIRKDNGLTQEELSELTGISISAIRKYESGDRVPKINAITSIAAALEVDLSELLQSTDYHDLTNMDKEDIKIYQDFLAPVEDYKDHIETFKKLGYRVIEHTGTYFSGKPTDGFIYDILKDDKVILKTGLEGFLQLGKRIYQYKQTLDKSLDLLVIDTVSNWDFIYGVTENEE